MPTTPENTPADTHLAYLLEELHNWVEGGLTSTYQASYALDELTTGAETDIDLTATPRGEDLARDLSDAARALRSASRIIAGRIADLDEEELSEP